MGLELHTRNLTDGQEFSLNGTEGVLSISYQMSNADGDSGTLLGNFPFRASSDGGAAVQSQPVVIPAGGGQTFVSSDPQKAIELTITCVQGTLRLILGF